MTRSLVGASSSQGNSETVFVTRSRSGRAHSLVGTMKLSTARRKVCGEEFTRANLFLPAPSFSACCYQHAAVKESRVSVSIPAAGAKVMRIGGKERGLKPQKRKKKKKKNKKRVSAPL